MSVSRALYDKAPVRVRAILGAVAADHGLLPIDLMGGSQRKVVRARWDAFYRLRTMSYGESYPSLPLIGSWFGLDHTTVLYGLRKLAIPLPPGRPDKLANRTVRVGAA